MDISQNVNYIERQKSIKKRKRKIVIRFVLLQLLFLAVASHYAQAQIAGIIKYYLLEVSISILLLVALACIKDRANTKEEVEDVNCKQVNEIQQDDTKVCTYSYNYNWIIKDTSKSNEKEQEQKEDIKEDTKEDIKETKTMYQSPFDAPITAPKKEKYRSPFEPINKRTVEVILDSARDNFCYSLTTNTKYASKKYKRQVYDLNLLVNQDITKNDLHEINERAKKVLAKIKQNRDNTNVDIQNESSGIDVSYNVASNNSQKETYGIDDIITGEYDIVQENTYEIDNVNVNSDETKENNNTQSYTLNLNNVIENNDMFKNQGQKEYNGIHEKTIEVNKSKSKRYKRLNAIKLDNKKVMDKITYSGNYNFPSLELLKDNMYENAIDYQKDEERGDKLIETLASFNVGASIVNISHGSSVTRYEILPDAGVKVSKIVNLQDDIALSLAKSGVRLAPVEGKSAIGIEVPNEKVIPVYLKEVLESSEFINHNSNLSFALGRDITGNIVVSDMEKMPHLLIAGATGSGKSVCLNSIIISILYKAKPQDVRMLMIDPKVVEMGVYNGIPHLLIPVVTEPDRAIGALNWAVVEMESRYLEFAKEQVRDLKGYNKKMQEKGLEKLPQILIIIDELADLMMIAPHEIEASITRLAQKARACGIHLVIATQRPSVDVITGLIKANIPSRISFAVASQIDSRTILDMVGAEKLLGKGDMLYNPIGMLKPKRVQGAYLSDKEVSDVVSYIKDNAKTEYKQEIVDIINNESCEQESDKEDDKEEDELLRQAIEMVLDYEQASASFIQRKFKVGYARAARILDQMEEWGIVAKAQGSKARQILTTKEEWLELNM